MKVKELIKKLNKAEFKHDIRKAKKLWLKLLRKSIKKKKTQAVQ
jgi:hypothetical protein